MSRALATRSTPVSRDHRGHPGRRSSAAAVRPRRGRPDTRPQWATEGIEDQPTDTADEPDPGRPEQHRRRLRAAERDRRAPEECEQRRHEQGEQRDPPIADEDAEQRIEEQPSARRPGARPSQGPMRRGQARPSTSPRARRDIGSVGWPETKFRMLSALARNAGAQQAGRTQAMSRRGASGPGSRAGSTTAVMTAHCSAAIIHARRLTRLAAVATRR